MKDRILFEEMGNEEVNSVNARLLAGVVTRDNRNVIIEILAGIRPDTKYFSNEEERDLRFPFERYIFLEHFYDILDMDEKFLAKKKMYASFEYTEKDILKFTKNLVGSHIKRIEFFSKKSSG